MHTRSLLLAVALAGSSLPSLPAAAQAPDAGRVVVDVKEENAEDLIRDIDECDPTVRCCPPNTTKKIIIGAATVVTFLVLFFLFVRLVERAFIKQGKSPLLGRHTGMSLALLFGAAAAAGIFFFVTGCWLLAYTYILGVTGVVWLLHLIYTLIAIRK